MAVCALVALDNLISFGAQSPERDRFEQRFGTLTANLQDSAGQI